MRIVYDDAKQADMARLVEEFMDGLDVKALVSYENGTDRVQMRRLKERLDRHLNRHAMRIGNTVTHAHGIGNNCRYPVYYEPDGVPEIQHCGNININTGLYGEGYVSCEDYDGNRIGPAYEIRAERGVRKKP